MSNPVLKMSFASIYPHYLNKVEKKGKTKEQLDEIIAWLTGYDTEGLAEVLEDERDFNAFFDQAPAMNPNRKLITGVVCGHRVEEIEDPALQNVRYLDKMIDELARGKIYENIFRKPA